MKITRCAGRGHRTEDFTLVKDRYWRLFGAAFPTAIIVTHCFFRGLAYLKGALCSFGGESSSDFFFLSITE